MKYARGLFFALAITVHMGTAVAATAFVDFNVVPMDRDRVLTHETVLVEGDKIVAVGPKSDVSVPNGALRIEGHGTEYLLPGLADMHTHLETPEDAALYVANGVTTALFMGSQKVPDIRTIRAGIAAGTIVAPEMFFGLMLDGPRPVGGGWALQSPQAAADAVIMAKQLDFDFIKVYNRLTAAEFAAIVDEGRKVGLPVIGHGVRSVGLPKALFEGQVMVAHAEEFLYTAFGHVPDYAAIPQVVDDTYRSGAFVTPNLSAFKVITEQWGKPQVARRFLRDPRTRYMAAESRLIWEGKDYVRRKGDLGPDLRFLSRFTKALADRGVPLLAGTDSPIIPGLIPGNSLIDEVKALIDAGLTPFQALSTATRIPGQFITKYVPRAQPFGTVSPGMRADLVAVAANPLGAPDTLYQPEGVMAGGRWRTAAELHQLLEANRNRMDAEFRAFLGEP
jgi:hypothetical protein